MEHGEKMDILNFEQKTLVMFYVKYKISLLSCNAMITIDLLLYRNINSVKYRYTITEPEPVVELC